MQNDMAALLLDENGNLKSFQQYLRDVSRVASHNVRTWLKTEYNTAVRRMHIAAQFKRFEETKDVLPNLEWIPSTAIMPGEDHRIFWHTIRPINDPFWDANKPGDRWNCQCDLAATDEPPTTVPKVTGTKDKPAQGLENNPAEDAKLFSDNNPMKKHAYPGAEKAVKNFLAKEGFKIIENPLPQEIKERRKELQTLAKANLLSKKVVHKELAKEISFTSKGIKEYLDQPHLHYAEKNELITNINEVLENATYKGITSHKGRQSHIFEIKIKGDRSWLIVNEYPNGNVNFYGISDSKKVLKGIKK